MSQNNVIFNVGGTKFEISKDLIQKYPNSELSSLFSSATFTKKEIFIDHNPLAFSVILDYLRYDKLLVPNNVAKEVIELQLKEFRIPYEKIIETNTSDDLPSYEATIGEFSAPYKIYQDSLKETVINTAAKRLDTLIQDVLLPYLKRHARRGHQQVTFYLTPNVITPKNITTDLDHLTDPHEWIYLPYSSQSNSTRSSFFNYDNVKDKDKDVEDDLPDIQFLLQTDNLHKLQDFIITKSGVKKVTAEQVEVCCRTENEFGLFSSKSYQIIQIDVIIV